MRRLIIILRWASVTQVGKELVEQRMTLNSESPCFHLWGSGITGLCANATIDVALEIKLRALYVRLALFQLS